MPETEGLGDVGSRRRQDWQTLCNRRNGFNVSDGFGVYQHADCMDLGQSITMLGKPLLRLGICPDQEEWTR